MSGKHAGSAAQTHGTMVPHIDGSHIYAGPARSGLGVTIKHFFCCE